MTQQKDVELTPNHNGGKDTYLDGYNDTSFLIDINQKKTINETNVDNNELSNGIQTKKHSSKNYRKKVCRGFKRNSHYKSILFTIVVLFSLVCMISCGIGYKRFCQCYYKSNDISSCDKITCTFPCFGLFNGIWAILFWIIPCIIGYFLSCYDAFVWSSSYVYLDQIMNHEQYTIYQNNMIKGKPRIWMKLECYHYEGSGEDKRTVITHTAQTDYEFDFYVDISDINFNVQEHKVAKLQIHKAFKFADTYTQQDYEIKKLHFISNNKSDKHQIFTYGIELTGFKSEILVRPQHERALSLNAYICATLCMFNMCYQMWLSSISVKRKIVFQKSIQKLAPINFVTDDVNLTNGMNTDNTPSNDMNTIDNNESISNRVNITRRYNNTEYNYWFCTECGTRNTSEINKCFGCHFE